jgi:hypothetical protein
MVKLGEEDFLVRFQIFFSRDVGTASKVSGEFASPIEGSSIIQEPSINPVMPPETVRHGKRFSRVKGSLVDTNTSVKIIGMDVFGPAITVQLLLALPRVVKPRFVEPVALLVRARPPNHHRGVVREFAKLRIAEF